MSYEYDLVVIGAGSGGVRASRMAAGYGARVAVVEGSALGGTCVNLGCIPKKLMAIASHFADDFEDAAAYGWSVGARSFDLAALVAARDREIARLNGVYRRLLEESGVEIVSGWARIADEHTVAVGDRRLRSRYLLVATGSRPRRPRGPGGDLTLSSDEVFRLRERPRRVTVVGGGYIAVEFAGIFRGLGSEVTVVHRGEALLRGFDEDVRRTLGDEMRKKGIELRLERTCDALERSPGGLRSALSDGSSLEADLVLAAIGRAPRTEGLGLESAGVALRDGGAIHVDRFSRTSVPSIYAIGDVTDRLNLTPVAIHEGMAVARTLFGGHPTPVDHELVPSAVFSQPPVGAVGLTEAEARARLGEVRIFRTRFRPLRHTLTGRDETVMMKLVVDAETDRVVGCHLVGADAPEILQGFAVALKAGVTKEQIDATIGIHPTTAEELVTMRAPVANGAS